MRGNGLLFKDPLVAAAGMHGRKVHPNVFVKQCNRPLNRTRIRGDEKGVILEQ